jgi:hypothetical protein
MDAMRRTSKGFVVAVVVLYAATWLVGTRTIGPQLEATLLNEWASFTAARHPELSYEAVRARAPNEAKAHDVKIVVSRVVPVLPGVALVWHEVYGLFNPGGTSRGSVEQVSLVLIYGVGARVLHSWPITAAP